MVCGLATEAWSRPKKNGGDDGYVWPNDTFLRRMLPHAFGYVPMIGAWVMMIKFLETGKHDVKKLTERDDLNMPDWVNVVLYGTVAIFWCFSFVQILFQYISPKFYWRSELVYCALSLTAKLYLGLFLLINVIVQDGDAEDVLGGGGVVVTT